MRSQAHAQKQLRSGSQLNVSPAAQWLFTAVLLPIAFHPLLAQDADVVCAHAVDVHRSGDIERAVTEYGKCLSLRPDVPELRSNFGAALAHLGRYAEAIEQYQQALRLSPESAGVRVNLALAHYKLGELGKAVAELQALRAAGSSDSKVTFLLADCYLQTGEFRRIIDLLAPLEPQYKDDRAFSYLLGMALIRNGEVAKGQLLVNEILSDGDLPEAHYLLATSAFMNGNYPAAVEEFQKTLKQNPNMPSLQSWYGQALLMTGDADGAVAAFRRELAANPNDYESNLKLGEILAQRRHYDDAREYLRRALQVRPGSAEARYRLAATDISAGQLQQGLRELQNLLADAPGFAAAHSDLARAYDQLHRPEDARRERRIAATLLAHSGATAVQDGGQPSLLPAGSVAPDFTLPRSGSPGRIRLASFAGTKPVVLIFGSYTCPKFRFDAAALNSLYERYGSQAQFLLVYVHEAHTEANWQSTVNQRERVFLPPAKTAEEKERYAATCVRKLEIKFPVAIDGLDQKVALAYRAWPSAAYMIGKDGRIIWRSRLGEQEFSAHDLEAAIHHAVSTEGRRQ